MRTVPGDDIDIMTEDLDPGCKEVAVGKLSENTLGIHERTDVSKEKNNEVLLNNSIGGDFHILGNI